jgi:hypothetical protein
MRSVVVVSLMLAAACGGGGSTPVADADRTDAAELVADAPAPGDPDAAPGTVIALVGEPPLPNWDGVYAWSLVLAGDHVYYSDRVLGAGYVWRVPVGGGAVEPAIPLEGAEANAEYCFSGGGERAGWIAATGTRVSWAGCLDRVRDVDATTGEIARIGTWDATYLVSTTTHLYGTRAVDDPRGGSTGTISAFELATGAVAPLAVYDGRPTYVAADDAHVYWSDLGGVVMRVPRGGGDHELVATGTSPHDLVVDDTHVYWADPGAGEIRRADKTGGPVETIAFGQEQAVHIALHRAFVYWTTTSDLGPGGVWRAPAAGGATEHLASGVLDETDDSRGPWDIVVDDRGVFWTELFGRGAVMWRALP